jgi:uncharacterized protein YjbJ (UPF0337 family)
MMNKEIIRGHWQEIRGKVKEQWSKVTDNDVLQLKGSYEELQGLLQKKYGYQKDQAEKEIQKFCDKHGWR